jgi:hypothetical protein
MRNRVNCPQGIDLGGLLAKLPLLAAALLAAFLSIAPAGRADQSAWQVCFTPGQDCTGQVVDEIRAARQSILVQAYSFTSVPILAALKKAKARGVNVQVIVDKTAAAKAKKGSSYTATTYLTHAGVPVWVDTTVAIAHNKAMVNASRRSLLPASSLNFLSNPSSIVFDGQSTSTRSTAPSASRMAATP